MVELAKRFLGWLDFGSSETNSPEKDGDGGGHTPRPMAGLFAQLSPEQRRTAVAYEGPIESGLTTLPKISDKKH